MSVLGVVQAARRAGCSPRDALERTVLTRARTATVRDEALRTFQSDEGVN